MNDQSLIEAYAVVHKHLAGSDGLMSQVEQGLEIDEASAQELEDAIERIGLAWRSTSTIPKPVVQLFCNLFPRLENCLRLYPSRELALNNLYERFVDWIDHLFAEEPLSEEAAIAIVHQQIGGLQPFALELRQGNVLPEGSLELFYAALDRLSELWQSKEYISKLAAGVMINAQEVFISWTEHYTGREKEQMEVVKQQVTSRITRCLL